jgi:hypothetical protein
MYEEMTEAERKAFREIGTALTAKKRSQEKGLDQQDPPPAKSA